MKNYIRVLRKKMKISQKELATRCNVTRQTIKAIENDKYVPTLQLAFKLSDTFKTSVNELFIYEGKRE